MPIPARRNRVISTLFLCATLLAACGSGEQDGDTAYVLGPLDGELAEAIETSFVLEPFGDQEVGVVFLDEAALWTIDTATQAALRRHYRRGRPLALLAPEESATRALRAILGTKNGGDFPPATADLVVYQEDGARFRELVLYAPSALRTAASNEADVDTLKEWLRTLPEVQSADLESAAQTSDSVDVVSQVKAYSGSGVLIDAFLNQFQVTWETFPFYAQGQDAYFVYVQQSVVASIPQGPMSSGNLEAGLRTVGWHPPANIAFAGPTGRWLNSLTISAGTAAGSPNLEGLTVFAASPSSLICCATTYTSSTDRTISGGISYSGENGGGLNFGGSATVSHSTSVTVPPLSIAYEPNLAAGSPAWSYAIQGEDGRDGMSSSQEFMLTVPGDTVRQANGGISKSKAPKLRLAAETLPNMTVEFTEGAFPVTQAYAAMKDVGFVKLPGITLFTTTLPPAEAPPPAQPTLASVVPGSAKPGTRVTLNGTNLSGTTSVVFGTENGLDVTVVSDSEIEVLVPSAKRGTVELTVQTPAGLSDQVDFAIR